MKYTLLAIFLLFGTIQAVTEIFDTGNYRRLKDAIGENFTFWDAKCRGELKIFQQIGKFIVQFLDNHLS